MRGVLLLVTCLQLLPRADSAQSLGVLHVKVVLVDAQGQPRPVPHHALLISDNPATAAPRLIITSLDGTADVKLRPGNYTVESDRPVRFLGKSYQWTRTVDILAGQDAFLELTAGNAEMVSAGTGGATSQTPLEEDPTVVIPPWQDSVVGLWTPFTHASGFLVDSRGLIATNQRVIGTVDSVEVQLTPAIKVEGRILVSDPVRDVALLWVAPKVIATVRHMPLLCEEPAKLTAGAEIFTIAVPLRRQKDIVEGKVSRVEPGAILSDFVLDPGSAGGPVLSPRGDVVGISSQVGDEDENRRGDVVIVPAANVCAVLAMAEKKIGGAPPSGALLPVEPARPFPVDALKSAVEGRAGSLNPYQISSSDFDVSFITPVQIYGAEHQPPQAREPERSQRMRTAGAGQPFVRPPMDFGGWSDYFQDYPAVLVIRVTPRLVEGFWTRVARGAARTQGVAIPPLKRFRDGFSRLRAFCGGIEVTPIHPFKLEQRVSQAIAISEGLYVFDPSAFGPHCGTVKLLLYSEKQPETPDPLVVDKAWIQRIWQDFSALRASTP